MFLFSGVGVLHVMEELAGQFTASAAVLKSFFVNRTIVHRTNLFRHHLFSPESRSFNINAPGAGFIEKFTFVAN